MDLRPYINTPEILKQAQDFVRDLKICYQPYTLTDTLQVGVGYEIEQGEGSGLIYWRDCPEEYRRETVHDQSYHRGQEFVKMLAPQESFEEFAASNQRLGATYDGWARAICEAIGDVSNTTFADVGCNSGYMPLSFARLGARRAVGLDSTDFTDLFRFFNSIMGTHVEFHHTGYNSTLVTIPGMDHYDVITTMAVACHLSDPLHFLSVLAARARKAIFFFSSVIEDHERNLISYGDPGKYASDANFPYCFDSDTKISVKLLIQSFEILGFTDIRELKPGPGQLPASRYAGHRALLAIRP